MIIYFTLLRGIILIIEMTAEVYRNNFWISISWIIKDVIDFVHFPVGVKKIIIVIIIAKILSFLWEYRLVRAFSFFSFFYICFAISLFEFISILLKVLKLNLKCSKVNAFIVRSFSVTLDRGLSYTMKQVSHVCFSSGSKWMRARSSTLRIQTWYAIGFAFFFHFLLSLHICW